ncbi:MAG: hypothetical protein Q8891_01115 [Bacteroidota bacterium]|nr:hypothetical protein [Bacteroidota bacterium]
MKPVLVIAILLVFFCIHSFAQGCELSPADCPDKASIENSQSSTVRTENGLLPQEIAMQDSMRSLVSQMLLKAAKELNWQMMELDEVTNLDPMQSAATPYSERSPRQYGIAFQFIVNKDSLEAWQNWIQDFNNRYENAGTQSFQAQKNIENSPAYKQAYDSMQYYTKVRTDYITAHPGIHPWEDKHVLNLQKKQDAFLTRVQDMQNHPVSSGNSIDDLDKEKEVKTLQFRNNTLVQVFFEFNQHVGLINDDDVIPVSKNIIVPGAVIAKTVHLPNPNLNSIMWHFNRSNNMKVLLLGNWILKPVDQNYEAAFTQKGQADEHTPKKIKSDKVQTIAIHVMGNSTNMDKLIHQLDLNKLNGVIEK